MKYPVMVKPGCTAYFHMPPAWMGNVPTKTECETAPESVFTQFVLNRKLIHGIKVYVRRDGVVIFDCRGWPEAGETEVPPYTTTPRKPIPKKVSQAEIDGELRAQKRSHIINAHQACLCTALAKIAHRSHGIGALVHPFQAYQLFRPGDPIPKWNHDVVQRFVTSMTDFGNSKLRRSQIFQRRLKYELPVLEGSLSLLEEIIQHPITNLLELTDLLYRAGAQYSLNRFQESIILNWSVCESLLNELWNRYIDDQSKPSANESKRISGSRKKKLQGRDFSASTVSEILELAGRLPFQLFERLNAARKHRNNCVHGLKTIGDFEVSQALWAAMDLYNFTTSIKLSLSFVRSGGSGGAAPKDLLELQDLETAPLRKTK